MPLVMPSIESAPTFDGQAVPDPTDWTAQSQADASVSGVCSGCLVSAGSGMSVNIASGFVSIDNILYVTRALTGAAVASASSTDRRDAVVVSQPITMGVTSYTNGGGAVTSIAVLGLSYAIPSGATVAMANGDMVTLSSPAAAAATTLSISSQTPSAGAGWVASSSVTPAWVISGTANPAGGAGWLQTSSISPPVKPAVPTGAVLVGEVYIEGTGATPTTSIASGNLVDKTTPVRQSGNWVPSVNAWTRVSATQFTQAVDTHARWAIGVKCRWNEANAIACTTNSTTTVTSSALFGHVQVGDTVTGTGIPTGTTVTAIASTSSLTLSIAATSTSSPTLTFDGVRYGYVSSSNFNTTHAGLTTVNLITETSYNGMGASPDAGSTFYCDAGSKPADFPAALNYSVGTVAGTTGGSISVSRFSVHGNICYAQISSNTLSGNYTVSNNGTTPAISLALPIAPGVGGASSAFTNIYRFNDNGTFGVGVALYPSSGSTAITLGSGTSGIFTNGHAFAFGLELAYPIA